MSKIADLPEFPEFTPLGIEHQPLLQEVFSLGREEISQHNFVELFAWREVSKIKLARIEEGICLRYDKKAESFIGPPVGVRDFLSVTKAILQYYRQRGEDFYLKTFTRDRLNKLKSQRSLFRFEEDRDDADYIYLTRDLIGLKGRDFDGKRNHINRFNKEYSYEFLTLTPDMLEEVIRFQENWCLLKPCEDDLSLRNENEAVREVLNNFNALPAFGAVIKISGEIQAYTIGTEMNPEMGMVIIEKANWEYRGIYQAINQMFAQKFLSAYKWINRQQDTGDFGLRKAKLSYHPHHLLNKFKVQLR